MKIFLFVVLFLLILSGCTKPVPNLADNNVGNTINNKHMKLFSNDFQNNTELDPKFTCDGENLRPHLAWSEVPSEAKSLALAVFDPDAPGQGWLHYLVVNMPAQDGELKTEDTISDPGIELTNDFGKVEYGGPCPPSGKHRYIFTLYALDIDKIQPKSYKEFLQLTEEHIIDKAVIIGLYQRQ